MQFSSSHLILIEKGAALNEVYEFEVKSLDNKCNTNLFPTTILIQNQDSSTRKSAVFALTMTQFTFAMSFNSASLNDLIVSCENVPFSTQNLKATRCSVIFPSLHFFIFIKECDLVFCDRFLMDALTYYLEIVPIE